MSVSISQTDNVGLTVESDPLALKIASNLSDLASFPTARTNLGVPVVATIAQSNASTLDTVFMSPDKVRQMIMFQGYQTFLNGGGVGTSGTGASAPSTTTRIRALGSPNALTAGYSHFMFDTHGSGLGFSGNKRGNSFLAKSFNRKIWMSGRVSVGDSGLAGDANNLFRCELGGRNGLGATGDPTIMSLGWKVAGGGSAAITFYVRTEASVNGGTYTEVATSFTPTSGILFDWLITYDGSGTSQMYVNDTLVGTVTATISSNVSNYNGYSEMIEQTITAAARLYVQLLPTRLYFAE